MRDYTNFYLGSVTVARGAGRAALRRAVGAPQRLVGGQWAEHQAIAGTAYIALWISLFALRPNNVLPAANLTFAVIGLVGTGRGGLISEFADHAGRISRERGGPAGGSPPQQ